MLAYILKRIAYAVPISIGVSVLCFSLVQLAPGDPLTLVISTDASQEAIDAAKQRYGLDQPLPVQYFIWLKNAVAGDLGQSIASGRPVAAEIGNATVYSLSLAFIASVIAFVLGCGMGVISGYTLGSMTDKLVSAIAISGVSIPHYWLGIVLVVLFSVNLNLLPAMGAGNSDEMDLWQRLRFMVLPAITLAAMPTGIITRSVRALVAEKLSEDFVTALAAKGLTRTQIFFHIVKNAAPTALAIVGVQMGYLMAGSILVETVFSWPGTGLLLNNAILNRDIPLLQGTILVLALFFVVLNLVVDIVHPLFDPRIKRA